MPQQEVHHCQCPDCLGREHHLDQEIHGQMNLLLSRLDEQQRRWYAAIASARLGHGGDRSVSRLTGLHVDTIRRGREELAASLQDRPTDQVRLPGGGRPALKQSPHSHPGHLEHRRPPAQRRPDGRDQVRPPQLADPGDGVGDAGLLDLPDDRRPAVVGPGVFAQDQLLAVHWAGPPRPGPAVRQPPGLDRHLPGARAADYQRWPVLPSWATKTIQRVSSA